MSVEQDNNSTIQMFINVSCDVHIKYMSEVQNPKQVLHEKGLGMYILKGASSIRFKNDSTSEIKLVQSMMSVHMHIMKNTSNIMSILIYL